MRSFHSSALAILSFPALGHFAESPSAAPSDESLWAKALHLLRVLISNMEVDAGMQLAVALLVRRVELAAGLPAD